MGREIIAKREVTPPLNDLGCPGSFTSGINPPFGGLFQTLRQISHAILTLAPLNLLLNFVRLACLIHAASVRSEPESNSPLLCKLDFK